MAHLEHLSFYAFLRLFNVANGKISRRQREAFVALKGLGWPSHASRAHALHEAYARKNLLAFAPCPRWLGREYIEAAVRRQYGVLEGTPNRGAAFEAFVRDPADVWCPK